MKEKSPEKIALEVSRNSIIVNLILTLLKLIAGIAANSGAMISDAVHSASDVFSTVIVIIGVKLSAKSADKEHPYGHERLECVASIVLAVVLLITGLAIGVEGIGVITSAKENAIEIPGALALAAAIVSIIVKEAMYWYTIIAAKKINSTSLKADAWHHRSDALSSIGALVGIGGAMLGFAILEPIASVVICLFIIKVSIDIFKDAVDKMVDKACDDATEKEMAEVITKQEGVVSLVSLQTRVFGSKIYVDSIIAVDGSLNLRQAHSIAENVHDQIELCFPMVKHCMVHVDPAE